MKFNVRGMVLAAGCCAGLLSACGGGGGGNDTKTEVLTLSGKIIAPVPGDADVTVTVDAKPYITKADGSGNFEIEIESADADALVTILTKLGSDQSFAELLGNLGSFGELQADAGDDDTLTADENVRANVSSLSTAEAVLIDEIDSGEGKAFTFGDGVDPEEALTLAAIIQLALSDPDEFELPQGSATTLELARNPAARDAFRDDIEGRAPEQLEQAKQDLVGNVDIIGPAQAGDVPPDLLAALLDERGDYPFNSGGLVDGFEFDADGTGVYFSNRPSVGMSWSLDGPKIRVEFDEPVVSTSFELVDCEGSGVDEQRESLISTSGVNVARLSPTAISVTSTSTITTADCPDEPSQSVTQTRAKTVLRDETLQDFAAADVAGRSLVLSAFATADQGGNTLLPDDLLSFAASGSGSGRFTAPAFSWSVTDGTLTVSYGNGIEGRYRPVLGIDSVARVVLVDYVTPDGRFADLALSFGRDPSVAFAASEIPARYFQFGVGAENGGDPRLDGFVLRLEADGGGAQEDSFIDENGEPAQADLAYALNWSLSGAGEVVINRYYDSSDDVSDCDPQQSQTCVLFDRRVLVPVNREGERYYWLERRRIDSAGVDASDLQTFIARFYDRVPLDSSKRASAARQTSGRSGQGQPAVAGRLTVQR